MSTQIDFYSMTVVLFKKFGSFFKMETLQNYYYFTFLKRFSLMNKHQIMELRNRE